MNGGLDGLVNKAPTKSHLIFAIHSVFAPLKIASLVRPNRKTVVITQISASTHHMKRSLHSVKVLIMLPLGSHHNLRIILSDHIFSSCRACIFKTEQRLTAASFLQSFCFHRHSTSNSCAQYVHPTLVEVEQMRVEK